MHVKAVAGETTDPPSAESMPLEGLCHHGGVRSSLKGQLHGVKDKPKGRYACVMSRQPSCRNATGTGRLLVVLPVKNDAP